MPLKCPLAAKGDQEGCVCVSGGGGFSRKGLGPYLNHGQAGDRRFMWGITNAPVTFSVNEKRGRANKRE